MNFNNPGNLEKTADQWKGAVYPGASSRFVTFVSPPYGYRALYIVLMNKIKSGSNTIEKIISSYAPAFENPTEAYINYVSINSGINRNQIISINDTDLIYRIGLNIARFETGDVISSGDAQTGFNMAQIGSTATGGYGTVALALLGISAIWLLGSGK